MTIAAEIARISRLSGPAVSDARIAEQARANVRAFYARQAELRAANLRASAAIEAAKAEFHAADIANGWA